MAAHFFFSYITILLHDFYLIFSFLLILLFNLVFKLNNKIKFPNVLTINYSYIFISIILIGFLIYNNNYNYQILFNNVLLTSTTINILKLILLMTTLISFLIIKHFLEINKYYNFEIIIFIFISLIALVFLLSSYDIISIYLTLEIQSLTFYILAALRKKYIYSIEAGFKYFIIDHFLRH